jgi:hypothetical protein
MTAGAEGLPSGRSRRVWTAIDERFGLSGLGYPVPAHANGIGYILGGITFFGFLILAATGVWLAQFYHPTPEAARESVVNIMNVAPLGETLTGDVDVIAAAGGIAAQAPAEQAVPESRTRGALETAAIAALAVLAGLIGLAVVVRAERFGGTARA